MTVALHNSCPDARKSPHDERGLAFHVRAALNGAAGPFELDVQASIERGSFVAIVGSSGAGKTTLLRLLAGLSPLAAGHVSMAPEVWCDTGAGILLPTYRRSIGFVFQDYALFPNMTVRRNVEYAMRSRDPDEVKRLLQLVDLAALADAYPARLSGGQKQRLALIRALARKPSLLMLDEPLSALDPLLRRQLQDELKRLHHAFGTTTLLISHDIPEILRLADRVIRLEHGKVVFDGSPAAAFGTSNDGGKLVISGEHINGPDENGIATVRIDGRLTRIRYRDRESPYAKGDVVFLEIDEAAASRPR
jgi:molybdate transport system ATP-binding protein